MSRETTFATPCSKRKRPDPGLLPAVERYESARIRTLYSAAQALRADFLILSGKLGLLAPSAPIEDYDQRLTAEQVPAHAVTIAAQLEQLGTRHLVFFTRSASVDPGVTPYVECIRDACERAAVRLVVVET